MFTRSPQGGAVKPIDELTALEFKKQCAAHQQKEWYVHAPYFINFASANPRIRHGSPTIIRDELERSTLLGARYLTVHLGSYKDLGRTEGFNAVIEGLGKVLDGYTGSTQLLIENAAGAGDVIGATFEEIAQILHHPDLKRLPIGVCFDLQHAFGSGYDVRTSETVKETFDRFDATVGLERLRMFHGNDSKVELGAHKDRHEHIGVGAIGLAGFRAILAEPRLEPFSFIAETEHDRIVEDLSSLKALRAERRSS
jgi:deoxyribonuclease-4